MSSARQPESIGAAHKKGHTMNQQEIDYLLDEGFVESVNTPSGGLHFALTKDGKKLIGISSASHEAVQQFEVDSGSGAIIAQLVEAGLGEEDAASVAAGVVKLLGERAVGGGLISPTQITDKQRQIRDDLLEQLVQLSLTHEMNVSTSGVVLALDWASADRLARALNLVGERLRPMKALHRFDAVKYLMAHPKRLPDQKFGSDSRGRVYLWDDKIGHERTLAPTAGREGFYAADLDQLVDDCLAKEGQR